MSEANTIGTKESAIVEGDIIRWEERESEVEEGKKVDPEEKQTRK